MKVLSELNARIIVNGWQSKKKRIRNSVNKIDDFQINMINN